MNDVSKPKQLDRPADLVLLRELLQRLLPAAQAGHGRAAGHERGCDGKLGADHLQVAYFFFLHVSML